MANRSVYEVITDCILEKLNAGIVPWRKTWRTNGPVRNLISGKPYRGINHFLLGCSPYASPYFLTFKQAQDCKGHVRKGEHGSPCVFWTEWKGLDKETGEEKKIPVLRYYTVFNAEQCEGIDHKRLAELQANETGREFNPIAEAESIVEEMPNKPSIGHNESRAYYRPATDSVNMPAQGLFESSESYYETLFHELAHSTGHASRLNRKAVVQTAFFGSGEYGQEELVAEMASAFLCGHCGIVQAILDNSAAYIGAWLRTIKEDAKLVVIAAAQAQKAADYILGDKAVNHEAAL